MAFLLILKNNSMTTVEDGGILKTGQDVSGTLDSELQPCPFLL